MRVPFHDVDSLKVVWHGHYLKYFEIARTAHLEALAATERLGELGLYWVVIDSRVRHVAPLRYGQKFEVACWLADIDYRVHLKYRITDATTGAKIAKGNTVLVTLDAETGAMLPGTPAPLAERLADSKGLSP